MTMIQTFPTGSGSGSGSNNGFYKTTDSITATIDATTTLDITNISGLSISDVIIGETIVYDSLGTNAVVTAKDTTNNTIDVKTISTGGTTHYHVDRSGQELKVGEYTLSGTLPSSTSQNTQLNITTRDYKSTGVKRHDFIIEDNCVVIPAGMTVEITSNIYTSPGASSESNTDMQFFDYTHNVIIDYLSSTYHNSGYGISGTWSTIFVATENTKIGINCIYSTGQRIVNSNQSRLIVKEIGRIVDPVEYVANNDELEETPVGNIISYMGNSVPKHHLACDGTEYAIGTYPELEAHILKEFGSINYFGGDGTTTWAVPDLNGEFLRGTGTNSHTNQGNGANVGEHQDATIHNNGASFHSEPTGYYLGGQLYSTYASASYPGNTDKNTETAGNTWILPSSITLDSNQSKGITTYTSRPTNTSVKFCIKYESTYHVIVPSHMYKVNATFDLTWNSTDQAYLLNTLTYKSGDQSLIDGSLFKAPLTGWYNISFNSGQVAKTTKIMQYLHIVHNGTATIYTDGSNSDTNTGWWGLDINRTFYLEKGDTVYARVWTEGQTITLPTNMNASFCLLTANYNPTIVSVDSVYSKNEQMIGYWTDGKPLYQKTFITTSPSAIDTSKNISIGATIDKGFVMSGSVDDGLGNLLPLPFSTNAGFTTPIRAILVNNDSSTNKNTIQLYTKSSSWLNKTTYLTIQYTKTTDTASSLQVENSLLLNRPDLWEVGKEYSFGGGLYGQRFTGNMPTIAAGKVATRIFQYTISSSATLVSCGGYITGKNAFEDRVVMPPNSVRRAQQDNTTTLAMGWTSVLILNNVLLMNAGSYAQDHFTTSDTYDVWVTYKK